MSVLHACFDSYRQFSLRTLCAAIGVVAILCTIASRELTLVQREDMAGDLLESALAREYGGELQPSVVRVGRAAPASTWRRFFHWLAKSPGEVDRVVIVGPKSLRVLDEQAVALRHLGSLEIVPCTEDGEIDAITQEHITAAARFRRLERLVLHGNLSRNLNMLPLQAVHENGELEIGSNVFPFDVLQQLATLNTLELDLVCEWPYDCHFPPGAFSDFGNFRALRRLSIRGDIGDDTFLEIAQAPNVTSISICSDLLTDAGLHRARTALHLRNLTLVSSGITDASVETLADMGELCFLSIKGTRMSAEGIVRLSALRPDLQIDR